MKKNESGFSVVEILIVIVAVGIIGAVGWFVYDRQKNETQSSTNSSNQQQETKVDFEYTDIVIPFDWKTYENDEFGFSFQYPADFSISEGRFESGESADKAIFYASANPPADEGVGGYEVRILKSSLVDAVQNDALNANDNEFEDTIKEASIYKSGFKTTELSYVPDGGKVSWFFIEKDSNTVFRFALVEDNGTNGEESKAVYNSLKVSLDSGARY